MRRFLSVAVRRKNGPATRSHRSEIDTDVYLTCGNPSAVGGYPGSAGRPSARWSYIHDPHLGAALAHENPSVGRNGISYRDSVSARTPTSTPALAAIFVGRSGEIAGIGVYLIGFRAHVKAGRLFTSTHVISAQRRRREATPRLRIDHAKHHRVVGPNHKALVRTDQVADSGPRKRHASGRWSYGIVPRYALRLNRSAVVVVHSKGERSGPGPNLGLFSNPAWGSAGNLGRNHFYGPGVNSWDMVLQKTLRLSERANLQFRTESYNLFNRVQFSQPDNLISDTNSFGQSSSQVWRPDLTTGARQIQFGIKLSF